MRVSRTYTIDLELIEKMKLVNASELINELLWKHFNSLNIKNMSTPQLKRLRAEQQLKANYELKLKELDDNPQP